jgi:hypothetical protein
LQGHKIDAPINSDAVSTLAVNRFADLAHFPEKLGDYEIGIAFPKGSDLASQFSEIIDRLRSDGTTDDLWAKWTAGDDGDKTVPVQDLAGRERHAYRGRLRKPGARLVPGERTDAGLRHRDAAHLRQRA